MAFWLRRRLDPGAKAVLPPDELDVSEVDLVGLQIRFVDAGTGGHRASSDPGGGVVGSHRHGDPLPVVLVHQDFRELLAQRPVHRDAVLCKLGGNVFIAFLKAHRLGLEAVSKTLQLLFLRFFLLDDARFLSLVVVIASLALSFLFQNSRDGLQIRPDELLVAHVADLLVQLGDFLLEPANPLLALRHAVILLLQPVAQVLLHVAGRHGVLVVVGHGGYVDEEHVHVPFVLRVEGSVVRLSDPPGYDSVGRRRGLEASEHVGREHHFSTFHLLEVFDDADVRRAFRQNVVEQLHGVVHMLQLLPCNAPGAFRKDAFAIVSHDEANKLVAIGSHCGFAPFVGL
eukprot:scaffold7881_cov258-Pinguiococcus_pyrenoidosus.AAC.7